MRKPPLRMCVGCREMKIKKELIRIVRTPAGDIELDNTGKKSGRGAYICPDLQCFKKAVKSKSIHKALEHEIPVEVLDHIESRIAGMNS
jgi:predicted RNA-binding protein YlxR (DUF448 family)